MNPLSTTAVLTLSTTDIKSLTVANLPVLKTCEPLALTSDQFVKITDSPQMISANRIQTLEEELHVITIAATYWKNKVHSLQQSGVVDNFRLIATIEQLQQQLTEQQSAARFSIDFADEENLRLCKLLGDMTTDRNAWKRTAEIMEANRNEFCEEIRKCILEAKTSQEALTAIVALILSTGK